MYGVCLFVCVASIVPNLARLRDTSRVFRSNWRFEQYVSQMQCTACGLTYCPGCSQTWMQLPLVACTNGFPGGYCVSTVFSQTLRKYCSTTGGSAGLNSVCVIGQ
jgi:hypothetical protein